MINALHKLTTGLNSNVKKGKLRRGSVGRANHIQSLPCKVTSASVIDCWDGLSMAFAKNCSTSPNCSSLIASASSCSGVLKISGVM